MLAVAASPDRGDLDGAYVRLWSARHRRHQLGRGNLESSALATSTGAELALEPHGVTRSAAIAAALAVAGSEHAARRFTGDVAEALQDRGDLLGPGSRRRVRSPVRSSTYREADRRSPRLTAA
jgi:hypothetical protein